MLFGLEIEMGHLDKKVAFNNGREGNRIINQLDRFWDIKYDISAGLEISTKSPFENFPFEEVRRACRILVLHEYSAHETCGIHFHFSGVALNVDQLVKLGRKIWRIANPRPVRQRYCGGDRADRLCAQTKKRYVRSLENKTKYLPVRITPDDHYECRVFNGTLNPIAIHHMWKQLVKEINNVASKV